MCLLFLCVYISKLSVHICSACEHMRLYVCRLCIWAYMPMHICRCKSIGKLVMTMGNLANMSICICMCIGI